MEEIIWKIQKLYLTNKNKVWNFRHKKTACGFRKNNYQFHSSRLKLNFQPFSESIITLIFFLFYWPDTDIWNVYWRAEKISLANFRENYAKKLLSETFSCSCWVQPVWRSGNIKSILLCIDSVFLFSAFISAWKLPSQ